MRVCVVVRPGKDTEAAAFILLRSDFGTRVLLGASLDADGRVVEWLELHVQTLSGLSDSAATWRDRVSSATLDLAWAQAAKHFAATTPDVARATGWESTHPVPMFVDVERAEPWFPVDEASGQAFSVCTDDAALQAAGLPGTKESLHRYWIARGAGGAGTTWVAATPGAPLAAGVRTRDSVLPAGRKLVPFNPEGGLLQARRLLPIGFEDYVDLLSGRGWPGFSAGPEWVRVAQPYGGLGEMDQLLQENRSLFFGGRGKTAALAETFHLRLQLVYQIIRLAAGAVADRKLPLLNLSGESFRVEIGPVAPGLPLLWTARPALVVPGQSAELPLQGSGTHHYLPLGVPATTIYRPEYLALPVRGRGLVRLRRIAADASGQLSVEGTLVTSERLKLTANDLVWLKLPLPGGAVDLFARLDVGEALASGESRFRTEPQRYDEAMAKALRACEGNAFDGTTYETVPMLSTPCDLYALGVLAVRALLVNTRNGLGVALDEILSLARQMGMEEAEGDAITRVRSLLASDSRWLASLGPHQLSHEQTTPETVFSALPEQLWWETIGVVARMFPGQGPDSYCRDFADVSPFAIEKVFGQPLVDLEKLLIRSRGLLLSDWAANREVAAVLARVRG
jgi:hypothetical protein